MNEKTILIETFSKEEYEDLTETVRYIRKWAKTLPDGKASILNHIAGHLEDYLDIVADEEPYEEPMTKREYLEMMADREEWKDERM